VFGSFQYQWLVGDDPLLENMSMFEFMAFNVFKEQKSVLMKHFTLKCVKDIEFTKNLITDISLASITIVAMTILFTVIPQLEPVFKDVTYSI
jgi:hypothetical protein